MSDVVELVPYDPAWPAAYLAIRDTIAAAFHRPPVLIEHIGSTAVPGLPAKPIIDIIVLVGAMPEAEAALPRLREAGFDYRPESSEARRLFLRKVDETGQRTHHLHIHDMPGEVQRHLLFRDCLRQDPETLAAYLATKEDLAARFHDDRGAYSRGKSAFIDAVVLAAGGPARVPWNI